MKEYAINALGQIEASAKTGIWDAHWGCAVIAGALLLEENLVQEDARSGLTRLLDAIMASHGGFDEAGYANRKSMGLDLFAERLVAGLAAGATEPKALGHDLIYSAYVLRALNQFEITPWESLLDGLTALIGNVKLAGPGWITVNSRNNERTLDVAEPKTGADYWTIFSNFQRAASMEIGDMQLGHLLTHGHAIEMLRHWADPEAIADFDLAYRKRLHALRLANEEQAEKAALPRRKIDPRAAGYWKLAESHGDMHGHVVKYAFSFLDLKRDRVSEADLEAYGRIIWPSERI